MTPEEASLASGIKKGTLLRYERGDTEPGALRIVALAAAYGVSSGDLLGIEERTAEYLPGRVVIDLDLLEAISSARTEADVVPHVLWSPPPLLVAVSVPNRVRVVSAQEATGIGAEVFETFKTIAPSAYQRWANQHIKRAAQ